MKKKFFHHLATDFQILVNFQNFFFICFFEANNGILPKVMKNDESFEKNAKQIYKCNFAFFKQSWRVWSVNHFDNEICQLWYMQIFLRWKFLFSNSLSNSLSKRIKRMLLKVLLRRKILKSFLSSKLSIFSLLFFIIVWRAKVLIK